MHKECNIEHLYTKHPEQLKAALVMLYQRDPEMVEKAIHRASLGNHLDAEMLEEALEGTVRYDGRKAPFWTPEEFRDLLANNKISLLYEKYNEYDLSYLAQYYYADFKSLGSDPITFVKLAEDTLHDVDNPKACEAAFWLAFRKINGD